VRSRTGIALTDIGPMRAARRRDLLELGIRDRRFGWPLEMVLRQRDGGERTAGKQNQLGNDAGEDGGGLVEGAVTGGAAAAQVVVVHRRQVIVDQRIGVNHFHRAGCRQGVCRIAADGFAGSQTQRRSNSFTAGHQRILHGFVNRFVLLRTLQHLFQRAVNHPTLFFEVFFKVKHN